MDIQYKYIHVRDKALKADHTIINYMYMYLGTLWYKHQ